MKHKLLFAFLLSLSSLSFAQDWTFQYTPYYRSIREIHLISMSDISALGGWPYNDSITDMFYTDNGGELWQFQDIFPGKMIKSGLYYDDGNGLCGGLNEACYRTVDSGRVWELSSFGINLNQRNINKFSKGNWGIAYACGGLDSISGFVIKSENFGENWTIISEFSEFEINAIEAIDNNNLVICGYDNLLKISHNAGENWQDCEIVDYSETCILHAIEFFGEDFGYCVGGRQGVDSLQLILKTIDGGTSWTPCLNTINPILNDIEIINDSCAYAVGDYGVILETMDYGESWIEIEVADNPEFHLYTIDFINSHYGVIAGNYGIVFYFDDGTTSSPEVNTYCATDVTSNSAQLNGSFDDGFLASSLSFRYGLDEDMEFVIPISYTFTGGLQNVSFNLQDLVENTQYFYCIQIENEYGTEKGDVKAFYTGNPIPNWDFEFWSENIIEYPSQWYAMGNCTKFETGDDFAVTMAPSEENDDNISALVNAIIDGDDIEISSMWDIPAQYIHGGYETSIRPDSIYATVMYDIEPQDSAMIFIAFLDDNEYVSYDIFSLHGVETEFTQIGYKLNYLNGNTPDRVSIMMVNSNPLDENNSYTSTLTVSEIEFSQTLDIPNKDFSLWESDTIAIPDSWEYDYSFIQNIDGIEYILPLERTEDSYFNDYAISIQNIIYNTDTIHGCLKLEEPKISIDKRYHNFQGYYKYFPEGNDTAIIYLDFFKSGECIGWAHFIQTETIDVWTNFNLEINYYDEIVIPDSMALAFFASQWPMSGESQLLIDKLSMDGDFIPVEIQSINEIRVYPNPVRDFLYFSEPIDNVKIFNVKGVLILEFSSPCFKINVSSLSPGIYFYVVNNTKIIERNKFIKK